MTGKILVDYTFCGTISVSWSEFCDRELWVFTMIIELDLILIQTAVLIYEMPYEIRVRWALK